MAVNPSIQLGTDGNWAIKEDNLLAYKKLGSRFFNREFDFSRGTTATFVGEDGLIQESAIDVPRIDFAGDTTGHLLLEPQSTNLITSSEDFSSWSIDDVTIQSDSSTSPDGNTKATLIKGNTNSSRHHIRKTLSGTVDASYSIFAKAKELRYLQIASINTTNQYVNFDLQDGLVGTVGSDFSNAKIEKFGSGWYRLSVTSDSRYNSFYISLVSGTNANWLESWVMSNNTDGMYIWGSQLEQLSYPTSYIPTNGSTVTRNQEICNNSGTASDFNSEEGVLYAEIAALGTGNYKLISLNNGASGNSVTIGFHQGTSNFYFRVASSNGTTTYNTFPIDYDGFNKIALKYKSGDISIFANGTKKVQSSGTFAFASSLNKLNFDYGNGGLPFYGKNKNLKVFKRALTDTELYLLTVTQYESYQEMATALNYTL
jgi:hypothetical protein